MTDKTLLTTREVAERFNVTIYQVNYAIATGRLRSERIGHIHVIHRDDLPEVWPVIRRGRRRRGD